MIHISETKPLQKGFSLLEILIAVSILSIGVLGVASMQIQASNKNTNAGRATQDMTWATEFAETILSLPYSSPLLQPATYTPTQENDNIDNNGNGQIDESGESGNIFIQWTVRDNYPVADCRLVQVVVFQRSLDNPGNHRIQINQIRSRGL